jgi:hypothetical protein
MKRNKIFVRQYVRLRRKRNLFSLTEDFEKNRTNTVSKAHFLETFVKIRGSGNRKDAESTTREHSAQPARHSGIHYVPIVRLDVLRILFQMDAIIRRRQIF